MRIEKIPSCKILAIVILNETKSKNTLVMQILLFKCNASNKNFSSLMKIIVLLIQKQNLPLVWWGPNIITNTHTDIILAYTQVVHSLVVPQNTAASKYY